MVYGNCDRVCLLKNMGFFKIRIIDIVYFFCFNKKGLVI